MCVFSKTVSLVPTHLTILSNQATLLIRPLHAHHLGGRGRGLQVHPYVPSGTSTSLMLLYTRGLSRAVSHRLLAAWPTDTHVQDLTRQQHNHTITIRLETCPSHRWIPQDAITTDYLSVFCMRLCDCNAGEFPPDVDRHDSLEESSNASVSFTCDTYRMSCLPGEIDLHRWSKTCRRDHLFGSN